VVWSFAGLVPGTTFLTLFLFSSCSTHFTWGPLQALYITRTAFSFSPPRVPFPREFRWCAVVPFCLLGGTTSVQPTPQPLLWIYVVVPLVCPILFPQNQDLCNASPGFYCQLPPFARVLKVPHLVSDDVFYHWSIRVFQFPPPSKRFPPVPPFFPYSPRRLPRTPVGAIPPTIHVRCFSPAPPPAFGVPLYHCSGYPSLLDVGQNPKARAFFFTLSFLGMVLNFVWPSRGVFISPQFFMRQLRDFHDTPLPSEKTHAQRSFPPPPKILLMRHVRISQSPRKFFPPCILCMLLLHQNDLVPCIVPSPHFLFFE